MEEINLNFDVRPTDANKWSCSFVLRDQEHNFIGDDPTDAVSKAIDFLGPENIRNATIERR